MKLHQLIFTILITGLFSCQNNKNEVIISGIIDGDIPEKIEYTLPLNGVCDFAFKESVQPDSLGNFTISLNIEKPSFVKIFIPGKAYGTLLVEKGINYEVHFDLKLKEKQFKILGENQKGQKIYNSLPNPGHIQSGAREFLKDSIATEIKLKLKSLKKDEVALFEELLNNGEISEDYFQLIKIDRDCYYSAIQGTVAFIKKMQDDQRNNGVFTKEIQKMWEESFVETSPTSSSLTRSPWYFSFAESFIMFKEYTNDSFDLEKLKEISKKGLRHTHNIEESKKNLSSSMLEYYIASYLYTECFQKKYEKELITLFDEFKKEFPNSEYTSYIEPLVIPIVEFHKKKKEPFSKNTKFIDGYEKITSLKESVSSLNGKKVYVDVWATWCGPCKAEFKHKKELKKLLAAKNVEILYISIDRDRYDTQWKDMIKFYDLEGYHIRANEELGNDLRKIFDRDGSLSIPWYILIDENGNIIKEHASRPSNLKELEKEINI